MIVNQGDWQARLAANKAAFANAWVQRPSFVAAFGGTTSGEFVERLLANTGAPVDSNFRNDLVNQLNIGAISRGTAMRRIVEYEPFFQRETNPAFVYMQYVGYLRRLPSDPPDGPDMLGFFFWLGKLNQFNGDWRAAEMVTAFITSAEYRNRFGSDQPFPAPSGGGGSQPATSGGGVGEAKPYPDCEDNDGEGFCDDSEYNPYDASIYPGAPTYCEWGMDRNCNGWDDWEECYWWSYY